MFSCSVHCVKFVKIEPVFENANKLHFKNITFVLKLGNAEQRGLYNINWLVFVTNMECIYWAVRTEDI